MAKILFVHQNFPGQFVHISHHMARLGHEVRALGMSSHVTIPGVRQYQYSISTKIPPYPPLHGLPDLQSKLIRGLAAAKAMWALNQSGFKPDLVVVHPGWGEAMYVRDIWPLAKQLHFLEFYYHAFGFDMNFDPEFNKAKIDVLHEHVRVRNKNISAQLALNQMDWGVSPTNWQKSTYPSSVQHQIDVIFDGIDTDKLAPNAQAVFEWSLPGEPASAIRLQQGDEVVTFINRNLEPYRGYHIFMRALPEILRQHPKAHVILVGGDEVSYGAKPPNGQSWKKIYLQEVATQINHKRVHFVGRLPRQQLTSLLQVSACHVYLTYPFVLSWSCIEAMSIGCPVVASSTSPVLEFIENEKTGLLFNFFDYKELASSVSRMLRDRPFALRLAKAARLYVQVNCDLKRIALPRQEALLTRLLES